VNKWKIIGEPEVVVRRIITHFTRSNILIPQAPDQGYKIASLAIPGDELGKMIQAEMRPQEGD